MGKVVSIAPRRNTKEIYGKYERTKSIYGWGKRWSVKSRYTAMEKSFDTLVELLREFVTKF